MIHNNFGWNWSNCFRHGQTDDNEQYFPKYMQIRMNLRKINSQISSSETTEPIQSKLAWNSSWVVSFQICVWYLLPPSEMTAVKNNLKKFKCPQQLWLKLIQLFQTRTDWRQWTIAQLTSFWSRLAKKRSCIWVCSYFYISRYY
jgi:hypothetical protein